jgi:hypothetical protein
MKGVFEGVIVLIAGLSVAFIGMNVLKLLDWLISFTLM